MVEALCGCELAVDPTNLERIYTYASFRLQRINLTSDVAICDELIARLAELREAWAQLAEGGGASQPTPTVPTETSLAVTI